MGTDPPEPCPDLVDAYATVENGLLYLRCDVQNLCWSLSGDATVTEGNNATYAVSFTGATLALGQTASIQLDTGAGSNPSIPDATEGIDYNSADQTITFFGSGPSSTVVQVATLADSIFEGQEEFSVQLSNPSAGIIQTGSTSTVIEDP